jgi:hypothetical protein
MALDPRRTARTAVLTPVGFGVLAFDRAATRTKQANAAVEGRVAPLTAKVKSLLDEARAEAKPTAKSLEDRFSGLTRMTAKVPTPKASAKKAAEKTSEKAADKASEK